MKYPKHKSFLKSFTTLLLLLLLVLGINIGYKQYNKYKRLNNSHESEVTMSTGVNNKVLDKESNNDNNIKKENINNKDNYKKEDINNDTNKNLGTIESNKYTSPTHSNNTLTYHQLRKLTATSIVDDNKLDHTNLSSYFVTEEISDEIYKRIYGYSFKQDAKINLTELRYVRILYYGFDNKTHVGELIVNKEIATDTCNIMYELYEAKYPMERMELIDNYKADDEASMAANNSSAFNYRTISGTHKLSNHSKGLAIDINPLYNPYVKTVDGKEIISPTQGALYADRSVDLPYLITRNDICYKTFLKYGFTWGGDWNSCKDYQHFEKNID
jgi:hypothetical protein